MSMSKVFDSDLVGYGSEMKPAGIYFKQGRR